MGRSHRTGGFRDLWRYFGEARGLVVVVLVLSLVSAVVWLSQPILVGELVDRVSSSQPVGPIPAMLGVLVLVGSALGGIQHYLISRVAEGAVRRSRRELVDHLLALPIAAVDRRRTGDLVSRVSADTTLLRSMLSQGLVESVAGIVTILGALVAMLLIDPILVSAAVGVSVVTFAVVLLVAGKIERASLRVQQAVGVLAASTDRALKSIRTVRAAGADTSTAAEVGEDADAARDAGLAAARVVAVISPISVLSTQGLVLLVLSLGGMRVAAGAITVAELVTFLLFLFLLVAPLGTLFGTVSAVGEALGGLRRIDEVLRLPRETDGDCPTDARLPDGQAPSLELRDVSFGYGSPTSASDDTARGAPRRVLDHVSFHVPGGSRAAIVGPSGAGKSTVLDLVERFYDPESGKVLIGGCDIRDLPRAAARSRISYVQQDAPAMAGSVRDNLTLGAALVDEAACRRALADVDLLEVVDNAPGGLDSEVGEGGVLLSGGERQRLAVASALLRNTDILLLDEATSHLDSVNEVRVRESVDAAAPGRTVLIVAHRLSTVRDADVIIVMTAGRVVATGTHTHLLAECVTYQELVRHQLLPEE